MEITSDDHILDYAGSFRPLRKVADGGMATVYEAEHLGPAGFAKRVALKVIHPQYASERHWLQLFIDEAKLSANLAHGNIVQIYQLGEVDGQYYMAMEYIQGPTLRSIIDRHAELRQPMPLPIAAYIASRVCRALDYAHNFVAPGGQRLDVVHRDVSPGNIMASWDGHIKLADFGIAKARTSFDPAAERHILMGKKHYMSPEQALALAVDARSDVFTLGVVLYEMLTLEPLFKEDITDLLLDEVTVHPLPSVRARVPQLPGEIEDVLTRALSRDPNRRPTAAAMGHALDRWIERQRPVATPDRLQEHLATLFPSSQKRTSGSSAKAETPTRFSNFKRGLRRPKKLGLWARLFGL
jgi:serine/threonine-protein kinase